MDGKFGLNYRTLSEQLTQTLLSKIASGEWAPGSQVPPEGELSQEYNLSGGTVRKALDFLEDNKFILRQQGRGTFVLDPAGQEMMRRFERFRTEVGGTLRQTLQVLTYEEGAATELENEHLLLKNVDTVRRLTRLRRFRDRPFMYEEIAIPAELFPASKDVDNPELWISTTARNCGVLLGDAEEKINLAPCPAQAALLLDVQPGSTVMRIRGVMQTLWGQPARWRDAYCTTSDIYYSVPLARNF